MQRIHIAEAIAYRVGAFSKLPAASLSRLVKAPAPAITEPTKIGNQYVIPGCERDKRRGPAQMDLF